MNSLSRSKVKRSHYVILISCLYVLISCKDAKRVQLDSTQTDHALPSLNTSEDISSTSVMSEDDETASPQSPSSPNLQLGQCDAPWERLLPRRLRPLSPSELEAVWIRLLSPLHEGIQTNESEASM